MPYGQSSLKIFLEECYFTKPLAIQNLWQLVQKCQRYPQSTRVSAMAEGLRNVLVSRNSAITKHPI